MTDLDEYCRAIEAYLCRKNDGHLIRITGAAFEQVQGWAAQGVPLKVAEAGIDRYFDRYYRKGPRRRPVRLEFCEADVLDAFDAAFPGTPCRVYGTDGRFRSPAAARRLPLRVAAAGAGAEGTDGPADAGDPGGDGPRAAGDAPAA